MGSAGFGRASWAGHIKRASASILSAHDVSVLKSSFSPSSSPSPTSSSYRHTQHSSATKSPPHTSPCPPMQMQTQWTLALSTTKLSKLIIESPLASPRCI